MRRFVTLGLAVVVMAFAFTAAADRGPWPEYRNGHDRWASKDLTVPIDPNDVKWEVEVLGGSAPAGLTLGPAVGQALGTVFLKAVGGQTNGSPANVVYCLDSADGSVIWETVVSPTGAYGYGGVCVGTDRVYAGFYNGPGDPGTKIGAFNINTGALVWENFDVQGCRGTPALGTVPNGQGNLNLYFHDRNGNQIMALDSLTGATQWTCDTSVEVGNVSFGNVGPLWVNDSNKQCLFISGDKGNATESGIAVQDNGDGTYTVLWSGGPISKNWKGNGMLSVDGTKIYTSTFSDDGAQAFWAIDITDGHVVWSARDVNSYPRPATGPDGTLYTAGRIIDGEGGGVAAYEEDANGCGQLKWLVDGLRGEVVGITAIRGYVYAADADGGLWVIKDHGAYGEVIRSTPEPIVTNWWWGSPLQIVSDDAGVGYGADNSREGGNDGDEDQMRKVWAFNPVPYTETGGLKITSISRGSIDLEWEPNDPAVYRVWRAPMVDGTYAEISGYLTEEMWSDPTPPADQAFYKVEIFTAAPFDNLGFYDFETGAQGWTHGGNLDDWELGTPSDHTGTNGAPDSALSGVNAWATKLAADYSSDSDCFLKSPEFTIPAARSGRVKFNMWMNSEYDIDTLNVAVYRAADDSLVTNLWEAFSATISDIDCWPAYQADIIDAAGEPLYLQFEFSADESIEGPGVYLDDVEFLAAVTFTPIPDDIARDGVVAFAPDGTVKWVYEAPGGDSWWNRAGYALSPDEGTLFALHRGYVDGGGIWAIDTTDGSVKWHLNTAAVGTPNSPDTSEGGNGDFFSTPVVGADGTLYSVDANGTVTAVRDDTTQGTILWGVHQPDGTASWNYTEGGIGPNGEVLFVADIDGVNMFQFDAAPSGTPNTWPTYQGGTGNTGYATGGSPATSTWTSATCAGGLWCGVAMSPEEHWIIPTNDAGKLKAYDTSLALLWEFTMDDWSDGGAAVAADGTIYAGDNSGSFFSVTEADTGGGVWSATENWKVDLGGQVNSRPSIGPDGTIYVVAGGGSVTLFALDPADGSTKWSASVDGGDAWQMATALSPSGDTVYFRTKGTDGLLYAIDTSDGSEKWTRHVGAAWDGLAPVVGSDGTIYQGATNIENPIVP